MAKAHIKTNSGTVITVEGDAGEIAKIMNSMEALPKCVEAKKIPSKKEALIKEKKKQNSTAEKVVELAEEGFFQKPKKLGEVSVELEKNGYLCPTTTLSGVMLSLVQKKILSRIRRDGIWVYGSR